MQWKTLFSIDPVKPLSIACLIHRPRKKITTSVFGTQAQDQTHGGLGMAGL